MNKSTNNKKTASKVLKILGRAGLVLLATLLAVLMALILILNAFFHGPSETARNQMINTLSQTSALTWVPYLFLPEDVINKALGKTPDATSTPVLPTETDKSTGLPPVIEDNSNNIYVTVDIGIGLSITLDSFMTVKSASVSDILSGFDIDTVKGMKFEDICSNFLDAVNNSGKIVDGKNNALLIGTVTNSKEKSESINKSISKLIEEKELPISVMSLFSSERDSGLIAISDGLGLSYNKVKLCNLIANGKTDVFYKLSMNNLTEILDYCNKNGIDIKKLVDNANILEQGKITDSPDDEWADYADGIRIENISGPTYNAHVMIIKDPSRVYAVASNENYSLSKPGVKIDVKMEQEGAVAAINGGYFPDQGTGTWQGVAVNNGGIPYGSVISNGKYVFENNDKKCWYPGFVGITEDNRLIVSEKFITEEFAKQNKLRDGIQCYPALIADGKQIFFDMGNADDPYNEMLGTNPRTAIGQRADGSIIFLTVDGRVPSSLGATMQDVIDILIEYKCVTGAALDGGSSSTMLYKDTTGRYGEKDATIRVNTMAFGYRGIPTYFMVKPLEDN